jgi:hypothetical protein
MRLTGQSARSLQSAPGLAKSALHSSQVTVCAAQLASLCDCSCSSLCLSEVSQHAMLLVIHVEDEMPTGIHDARADGNDAMA